MHAHLTLNVLSNQLPLQVRLGSHAGHVGVRRDMPQHGVVQLAQRGDGFERVEQPNPPQDEGEAGD